LVLVKILPSPLSSVLSGETTLRNPRQGEREGDIHKEAS